MMKKTLTVLFLLCASLSDHAQQGWIDVTDGHVINPSFDNDDITTGWKGTAFGAFNPIGNAEHYNKTYDSFQDIAGLEAGVYRVSLSAFYRYGGAEQDYGAYTSGQAENCQYAHLYAKSAKGYYDSPLVLCSSATLGKSPGGATQTVGNNYIPDNMEAAHYWFEAGYYNNYVDCEVDNDGLLTIGIWKNEYVRNDWTCLDNWKLEVWGTIINVTSIVLSETNVKLSQAEKHDLTATVYPADATYKNVTWSSTKESVAIVDSKGQITAVGVGSCSIIATAKDGSGQTARCRVTVNREPANSENLVINEIMAANADVYLDPSFNYGSWVELYNPTDKSVALGGLYITDDPDNLKKNRLLDSYDALPAKGYAILNFDHHEVWTTASYRQIDDKLDCDGGVIIISDGTNIIAEVEYPYAIARTSYALTQTPEGEPVWRRSGNPTPGAPNDAMYFAEEQLDAPVVDKDGGLFDGTLQICVNIPNGATLKYTTDGTSPTLTNGETSGTGIFTVDKTTCYRFRLFKDGYLPSPVVTRSYIYQNRTYPFPIISVVTKRDNLYSSSYGVFQRGPNGRPGNGQTSACNWNMDWDRPVSFEYITDQNEYLLSQECDLSICGGWTRASDPKSFKLKATKTYDQNNFFKAQFFTEKPYIKNKTLQIRNGGNDGNCRVMDAAIQQVVGRSGFYVDYQAWQPVHVFINGSHYAVLNMREPNNKHHAYANYGLDTDEMDQFEVCPDSGYVQMEGTKDAFNHLMELSENAQDENTYEEIRQMLDVDEFINYMAVELHIGNWDWPQNNLKGFRGVNDGKFHFVLFDLDGSFNVGAGDIFNTFFNKENYRFDTLHGYDYSKNENIEGKRINKQIEIVTLFKNLLRNDKFRKQFIDSFCIAGGSVFQQYKVEEIVNDVASYLETGNFVNPWNTANKVMNQLGSRNNSATQALQNNEHMQLRNVERQKVSFSANVPDAKIMLNDLEVPYAEFDGYLFGDVTLKAQAPAGYRFAGWVSNGSTQTNTVFNAGTTWKYYDQGSLDNVDWKASNYNDTQWKEGLARLGYDYNQWHTGLMTETEGYLPTYYFRKTFNLTATPSPTDEFILDYIIDDGMIVYINGVEAGRYNMPSGNVSYNSYASTYAHDNPDKGQMTLKGSLFKKGQNVIAIEVHNNYSNTPSSDILLDASLLAVMTQEGQNYVSTDTEYTLPSSGTQKVIAMFEKISEEDMLTEGITPVRINEVSAANSIYVNDYYKKNDWMELYNTTDKDIDIKGMTIIHTSDKSKQPKWHEYIVPSDDVTLNTIIPAHGYKVIWCDQLDIIGADIHTDFKLETKGGDIIIATENYKDTLSYEQHLGTQTYGRYPDGANDVYVMNIPTIDKTNRLGSYDTYYEKPVKPTPEPDAIQSYTKEGGITIAYVDGSVNIKSEDSPIQTADIYNMSGMKMAATSFAHGGNKFVSINVASLPEGIYLVSTTTEDGDECHIKFVIK
ncbi:MAG: CotH kinase family protein [Bacteroidaceae bacterium]|nr:CotH kinase family protein [Bacteroidaceae bacterium]